MYSCVRRSYFNVSRSTVSAPSIASLQSSRLSPQLKHSLVMSSMLPDLVVFDLDECLWSPEMYSLDEVPTEKSKIYDTLPYHHTETADSDQERAVVGVKSGRYVIRLYPAASKILSEIFRGKYGDMRIAAASSADTPRAVKIGRTSMQLLEVLPGVTMKDVFDRGWPEGFQHHLQIGRSPPLSSNKSATHFPILREHTGISYDKMIFFDDCNWSDNCAMVEQNCPGVVTQRTPCGLQEHEWIKALQKYECIYNSRLATGTTDSL